MPKRKSVPSSDEDEDVHVEQAEVKKKSKKTDKPEKSLKEKTTKKPNAGLSSPSKEGQVSGLDKPEIVVHTNNDGEKYLDLGRNRRATVRAFKGVPLLDIREYYGSGSDVKPGKKGISLKAVEWEVLKQSVDAIDKLFSTMKE